MIHVRSCVKAETMCGLSQLTQDELLDLLWMDDPGWSIEELWKRIDCLECFQLCAPGYIKAQKELERRGSKCD